jgi:UDP-N-acetylmuramoyl-L-alanyl-D-glutamate--2,6-diaminopimelate ligase
MKLKKLLKDIAVQEIKGSKEIEITGICSNSKLVAPGNLFIAKKGLTHDGARFIPEAIAAGAVAVLTDIFDPFLSSVVQIIHPDVAAIEAKLAATYYQHASDSLFMVGITGTNGKTTCTYLVKHLLDGVGGTTGLIGTIEWIVGKSYLPSTLTTSDVITNHKLFYEMQAAGCNSAVMEVSSHALDQKRVEGIDFDVAVFTNLTLDHLDYHKTMEKYAEAKAKLFSSLNQSKKKIKCAVVNADSQWTPEIVKGCQAPIITYGIENKADLQASEIVLTSKGMQFTVNYQGKKIPFSCSLIGRFNVYNCLAALAVALIKGIPLETSLELLRTFKRVPGRLERDYAHTDDALQNVLLTLRETKKGRLITVFGCGGNRDQSKRPKMGEVAERLSDVAIITSDNPRSEDPKEIINQILAGLKNPLDSIVISDRKEAITHAVRMASDDDIVLIAGKGHENYQIFAHQTIAFDDRKIALQAIEQTTKI